MEYLDLLTTMFQPPQIASTCAVANGNKINNKFWLPSAGGLVAKLRPICAVANLMFSCSVLDF